MLCYAYAKVIINAESEANRGLALKIRNLQRIGHALKLETSSSESVQIFFSSTMPY